MRYNDPTGFCTGDPDDPHNPDRGCWRQYSLFATRFPSVTIDGEDFDFYELQTIYNSMIWAKYPYGQGTFGKVYGNINIQPFILGSIAGAMSLPGGLLLIDKQNVFYSTYANWGTATFTMFHELAHQLDYRSHGYLSYLFGSTFATDYSSCKKGIVGCLNSTASLGYKVLNKLIGEGGWSGYQPVSGASKYGSEAAIDDLAESYATAMFHTYIDSAYNSGVTENREEFIWSSIVDYVKFMTP